MGIDIAKIRASLGRLDGSARKSSSQDEVIWKPDAGDTSNTYTVRFVPYKYDRKNPFVEFYWHYKIGNKSFLCPKYHGEGKCPVCDFASTVWKKYEESGEDSTKELFKSLMPKLRVLAPIVVRGEEDKGIRVWNISEGAYKQIVNKVITYHEDGTDVTDVKEGLDFKVTATSKKVKKPWGAIDVDNALKLSPLLSKGDVEELIDSCPDITKLFEPTPLNEVEQALSKFANEGVTEADAEVGIQRNVPKPKETSKEELEKEMDEIFDSGTGSADSDDLPL